MSASRRGVDRPCIVLGGGITGLGMVRSLGRAGAELHVVAAHGDLAGHSRFVTGRIDDVPETDDPEVLVRALVAHGFDEAVLFPCSDTWAQAVARMSEEQREPPGEHLRLRGA